MTPRQYALDESRLEITTEDVERRKLFVGLDAADLARISTVKDRVTARADEFTEFFFECLKKLPEAQPLFDDAEILGKVRQLKRDHLVALVGGVYGREYAEQRFKLGMLYSRVGLDTRVFLGAFHQLLKTVGSDILLQSGQPPVDAFEAFMSVKKVCFLDIGIIVDVLIDERERTIKAQDIAIREANRELEAFSYSVAHDLRTPLRSIDGFSLAILEDYGDKLDDEGKLYLGYLRNSAQKMAQLIDALLGLSKVSRAELRREPVNISDIASDIVTDFRRQDPARKVEIEIERNMAAKGDPALLRTVLENLMGNAWKFTAKREPASIALGSAMIDGRRTYYVRDNGAGFDKSYAHKLFGVFQRLHSAEDFDGTGIGLATVQRIIARHGGRVWAEGDVDQGATFYFTIAGDPASTRRSMA